MHASHFFMFKEGYDEELPPELRTVKELALSQEVSEWLFNICFWAKFNDAHGTFFDQYEEENISELMIPLIIKDMQLLLDELTNISNRSFHFCYARSAQLIPLSCQVEVYQIQREISYLIEFFETAAMRQLSIECSL